MATVVRAPLSSPTASVPSPREVRLLSDTPLDDDAGDVLGFDALAEVLAELVDSERTATPLTLAISAPWGAGKTTMALMVQRRLAQMTAQRNWQRPTLASYVKSKPAVMRELEDDARTGKLGDTFHDLPARDLAPVLREEPPLSGVVERLIRFEPGSAAPHNGNVVLGDEQAQSQIGR